jgi:hypothetical protein
MPEYEVLSAVAQNEKTTEKWGHKKDIVMRLKAADGVEHEATWWADGNEAVPKADAKLNGEIKPGQWGPKFFPDSAKKGGRGGGGKSPEERRSISMQHAQKCAVDVLALAATHGQYSPPSAGDVAAQVKTIAQTLWQQVQDAERNAPGTVHGLPVRNEPEKTGAPEPTTPSADYDTQVMGDPAEDLPFEAA